MTSAAADLTEHNGRHRLRMCRTFAAPAEAIWRALIDPELLSRWYPARVSALEPRVGGSIHFSYDTADASTAQVSTGQVTEFVEPEVFAFVELAMEDMPREGDSLLRFELTGEALAFTQEFDDRPAAASYAFGWESCFDALDRLLGENSGTPPVISSASETARYERYVHLFGLDEPAVSPTQVTIERQLMMRSPQQVWAILAPNGTPALHRLVPPQPGTSQTSTARVTEIVDDERITIALADHSRVEWEVVAGPGGARLVITQGPVHGEAIGEQWRAHVESLVAEIYAAAND